MLFNSSEFAVFLLVTLAVYFGGIRRRWWRARKTFLVVASYVFYMSWNPAFGLLLFGSTVVDYVMGLLLDRTRHPVGRRGLLAVSLVFNLGVLGYFKYGSFIAENVVHLFGVTGVTALDVLLPVGISFYTFESLSYTVNVYRGERACRSFLDFALFLSFFPHLVAGPIVRPQQFLPQLATAPVVAGPQIERALARIAQGLLKKVLLADLLGVYVDQVWSNLDLYPAGNVALAFYAYAFQIYFDFSGYTDIAIGVAQLFGLWLPENFARPYLARNPREFWQRWHISLSTWLRDYLYVSLGGNRGTRLRTYVNLFLTMLLGGLWHGAAWTFVVWGGYHGALLIGHRLLSEGRSVEARGAASTALRRLATFHLVVFGWIVFRAPSMADVGLALGRLAVPGLEWVRAGNVALIVLTAAALLHLSPPAARVREWFATLPPVVQGLTYSTASAIAFMLAPAGERFIYFQF
jgi:D-alanyl-lipoteichoic acid acyltransferase DltB (MBOAT superfamily)